MSDHTKYHPPFRWIGLDDPVATAPKDWLVEGVLGAEELSGIIAPSFLGKSTLAADLCGAVASGQPWFGRATKRGAVLFFALERWQLTHRRLRAYRQRHGLDALDNLAVINERIDLLHREDDLYRLIGTVKAFETAVEDSVALVVIDTVRGAMPGGDENSARDMGLFSNNLVRLQQSFGGHVMVIHHTPKGRNRESSGHTSLPAVLDTEIVLAKNKPCTRWSVSRANDLADPLPCGDFKVASVLVDGDSTPVIEPLTIDEADRNRERQDDPTDLKGDLRLTFNAIAPISPTTRRGAREASYAAYGRRSPSTLRRAFNDNLKTLVGLGYVQTSGSDDDASVSVSVSVRGREVAHAGHREREREAAHPFRGAAHDTEPLRKRIGTRLRQRVQARVPTWYLSPSACRYGLRVSGVGEVAGR